MNLTQILLGFRIFVSVEDYDFNQIKKISQQYMKFESVIEYIIPHLDDTSDYNTSTIQTPVWEVIYIYKILLLMTILIQLFYREFF